MIGACICIPSQSMREIVLELVDFMRKARVNAVMWLPSFAQLVNPEDVPDLKLLDVGDEQNATELVKRWAGRVRMVNGYGPAEASGKQCAHECFLSRIIPFSDFVRHSYKHGKLAY
jgi:non-ribosomal peptide synthetase component F